MTFDQRRQWVDGLRRIPLQTVLRATGATADTHDPAKWHTAQGVLSVNGAKFINWSQNRGGGGAIDLAMHLNACDFNAAVNWLAQRFSSPLPFMPETTPSRNNLHLPPPDPLHLPKVLRYLIEQRQLPDALLTPLVHSGQLYADHHANALFVLWGTDLRPVGAELRGTCGGSWRGLAPGSRKDLGYFSCGPACPHAVILCESAIDAISCHALFPDRLAISTAGARPNPAWLASLLAQGLPLYCGFDADPTGERMAQAMITLFPTVQRLRPPLHDWNDVLTASA